MPPEQAGVAAVCGVAGHTWQRVPSPRGGDDWLHRCRHCGDVEAADYHSVSSLL